jgi:hypothetical protein
VVVQPGDGQPQRGDQGGGEQRDHPDRVGDAVVIVVGVVLVGPGRRGDQRAAALLANEATVHPTCDAFRTGTVNCPHEPIRAISPGRLQLNSATGLRLCAVGLTPVGWYRSGGPILGVLPLLHHAAYKCLKAV